MKGWIARGLLLGVLCVAAVQGWSEPQLHVREAAELDPQLSARELLQSASAVPETEDSFVHIGGGFFAYFNRKGGTVQEDPTLASPDLDHPANPAGGGEIGFSLEELRHQSRLVYRPQGSLVLKTARGGTQHFAMELLDYVQVSGRELPCYRLSARSEDEEPAKAILICRAVGTEIPTLVGTLYLVCDSGRSIRGYAIQIRGRSGVEAENHLWKVVQRVSRF
jgi:hypothetical protein